MPAHQPRPVTLGAWLLRRLVESGMLSYKEVATRSGLDVSNVRAIACGSRPIAHVGALCSLFAITGIPLAAWNPSTKRSPGEHEGKHGVKWKRLLVPLKQRERILNM